MKMHRIISVLLMAGLWSLAWGQKEEGPVGVPVRIWGASVNPLFKLVELEISATVRPSTDVPGGWFDLDRVTSAKGVTTDKGTAFLEPGKVYPLTVESTNLSTVTLNAVPPPGYLVEIAGMSRSAYFWSVANPSSTPHADVVFVRVYAPTQVYSGRAGSATSMANDRINWQVALGGLKNGGSAGSIAIIDAGDSATWSSLFTPAGLQYESTSGEVAVYRDAGNQLGNLRQIIANEACVDVVTLDATSYELRFYHPSQKQGTAFPYTFSGSPDIVYKVERNGGDTNLKLTSTTSSRTAVTTLARTGTWPGYDWNLQDWNTNGASQLVAVDRQSGGTTQDRTESIATLAPGGATADSVAKVFSLKSWGEVVATETHGSSNAITTAYDYYADSSQPGSYGFLKSTQATGGSWEAYEYYDATTDSNKTGTLKYRYRPYLNSPAPVSLDPSQGEATYFEYATDAFGMNTRPTLIQTKVNGTLTAQSTTSYVDADANGNPLNIVNGMAVVVATRNDYTDASNYLTTVTRYYREDTLDDFFRGQINSITRPDGVKVAFAYQRGTWDGSNFTKSSNNGLDAGAASRIAVITGTAAMGSAYTAHDGYTLDPIYLVEGKSTLQVTIRDSRALVVHTESQAWKNGTWNLVGSTNYAYNDAAELTGKTTNNGGVYSATYNGEQKSSETDESGITLSYTNDSAGRVLTVSKSSGPTTTFTYDAAGRSLSENVTAAGTGENIYSGRTYDTAGRLATELPVGQGTTSYSYDVAGRSVTATYPDAGTRTEYYLCNGSLEHVDGTAVVPVYYTYSVESDGRRTTQVNSGASGSARWQKSTTDWLGRGLHSEHPGFSISSQAASTEDNTYEAGTGRLLKTARTGLAPIRYEYDALSNVVRTGLDIGDDGLVLNSADRITDTDQFFDYDGSWWLRQETKTYPKLNDATVITTSVTRKRLTGHPAGRLDETQVTDAEGNTVTRVVDVVRSTATATITTTRPSVANPQVETIVNGLSTSSTGHDGLTSTAQYDALSRAWKTIDPRNNTVTTTYKYGTALVQSVTDGAGNNLGIISYDGMARKQAVQDANGKYTRFDYNPRGQLMHQWGDGAYPVSYAYDSSYGDRIAMSTYRDMSAADSTTWPAGGTYDSTSWTFDAASGLLWKKTDAGGQVIEYDYNVRGQTASRKWARSLASNGAVRLTSSYTYDANTGELLTQSYNDGADPIPTPGVTYGPYTRLGQVTNVTDATGSRAFNYNATSPWRLDSEALDASFYAARVLTRLYDSSSGIGGGYGPYTPGYFKGRYIGFELGVAGNQARDQHMNYTTDNLGRFVGVDTRVTVGATREYVYNYYGNSALIGGYAMGSFTVARGYEAQRDVLTSVNSQWYGASITRYDYTSNSLGQRTTAKQSGSAFADYVQGMGYGAMYNVYGYNARGELQTAARYRGDSPTSSPSAGDELPSLRFEYRYDSIGNRVTVGATGTTADDTYTANGLNQYSTKDNKTVKVIGTAAANASVVIGGTASTGKTDRAWGAELSPGNGSGPVQGTATVYAAVPGGGSGGTDLVRTDSRDWFIPALHQAFTYDADGNMTGDGNWTYTYNAENQLVRMASVLPAGFTGRHLRLDFKYDYQGRRVEKRVYDNDLGTETTSRRFLYDGANLIAETDIAGNLQRTFTWGLDLAGSTSAAGGVGALLQIDDLSQSKTMAATYDGNGNLAALVNVGSGAVEAAYEYDTSGNLLRCEGSYAKANPIRFSTKWQDDESGLINYGLRYYSPSLGRFLNRDTISEQGGLNLYAYCCNNGVNKWDYLGNVPIFVKGSGGDPLDAIYVNKPVDLISMADSLDKLQSFDTGWNAAAAADGNPAALGAYSDRSSLNTYKVTYADGTSAVVQAGNTTGAIAAANAATNSTQTSSASNSGANTVGTYSILSAAAYNNGAKIPANQNFEHTFTQDGSSANLYRNTDTGQLSLAYKGSSTIQDWLTDFANAFGFKTAEYTGALAIGRMASDYIDQNFNGATVTVTGHSLGGGEAALVASQYGYQAVTFNAAGPNLALYNVAAPMSGQIVNYHEATDIVTLLQTVLPVHSALGTQVTLMPGSPLAIIPINAHLIGSVESSLGVH